MTKIILCCFGFVMLNSNLFAQETGRMETDRPDQTESPVITKKNYIQAEIGFNIENEDELTTIVHPTTLIKYGISKKFEFRLITELITKETPLIIPAGNKNITGIPPVQIGGKLALWEEKGLLPMTSLIFHAGLPKVARKEFQLMQWAPNFRFTMQHTLSNNIGLGYNIGAEWDGMSNTPYWVYTIAPGFNIGKNWYGYVEAFGSVRQNDKPQHGFDAGVACYFSDDTKIDLSGGVGLNKESFENYVAIGFSFRFNTKKGSAKEQ
ncbi:MAG: transporter [Chitinophagales bacterium]|nr:transporter [Chitinophagales bacterium]